MPLRQIQTFNVPCISMTNQSWRRLHSYHWLWDHFRRKLVCVPPLSLGRNVVFAPSERFLLVRGLALMKENFSSQKSCLQQPIHHICGRYVHERVVISVFCKKSLFWDATVQLQIKEVDKMWQAQRVDYLTSSRRVRHLSQQSRRILIAYCINLFLFGVHYPLYQQSLSFVIEKDSAWIFIELALNLATIQFRTQA